MNEVDWINNVSTDSDMNNTGDEVDEAIGAVVQLDNMVVDEAIADSSIHVVIERFSHLFKHMTKAFISILNDHINISFRLGLDHHANIVLQISKEKLSNFSYTYK